MGYRFVPECNNAQESRACPFFFFFFSFSFLSAIFAGTQFVEIKKKW